MKKCILLALFLFSSICIANQSNCNVQDILGELTINAKLNYNPSDYYKDWNDDISRLFSRGTSDIQRPQRISIVGKFKDGLLKVLVKSMIKFKLKKLNLKSFLELSKEEQVKFLKGILEKIKSSKLKHLIDGPIYKKLVPREADEGTFLKYITSLLNDTKGSFSKFENDIKDLKQIYGEEFFPDDDVLTAKMNVLAMDIFAKAKGISSPPQEAINSIAMLHPLVDGMMDSGKLSKSSAHKIQKLLLGETVEAADKYEKIVFDMINNVYKEYPPREHPALQKMFNELFLAQIKSTKQKGTISTDEIISITSEKGGLSTSMFGYIATGGLSPKEFEFFYKGGSVFQLTDDFADIVVDTKDGIKTVWTKELSEGNTIETPLRGTYAIYDELNSKLDNLTDEFSDQYFINEFFRMSINVQTIISGAKADSTSRRILAKELSTRLGSGLSPKQMEESIEEFLNITSDFVNNDPENAYSDVISFLLQ